MTKDEFLDFLGELVNNADVYTSGDLDGKEAKSFSDHLSDMMDLYSKAKDKNELSEKAQTLITCMKNNKEKYNNIFTSSDLAKELNWASGRSVSGVMKSLVDKKIVTKEGKSPVVYSLVDK